MKLPPQIKICGIFCIVEFLLRFRRQSTQIVNRRPAAVANESGRWDPLNDRPFINQIANFVFGHALWKPVLLVNDLRQMTQHFGISKGFVRPQSSCFALLDVQMSATQQKCENVILICFQDECNCAIVCGWQDLFKLM